MRRPYGPGRDRHLPVGATPASPCPAAGCIAAKSDRLLVRDRAGLRREGILPSLRALGRADRDLNKGAYRRQGRQDAFPPKARP